MSGFNLPENVSQSDIENAAPDDLPGWEQDGETLLREGAVVWLQQGDFRPVRVELTGLVRCLAGTFRILAREVDE